MRVGCTMRDRGVVPTLFKIFERALKSTTLKKGFLAGARSAALLDEPSGHRVRIFLYRGGTQVVLDTVSFEAATETVRDSSNNLGQFTAGEEISISGARQAANNGSFLVLSSSASALKLGHTLVTRIVAVKSAEEVETDQVADNTVSSRSGSAAPFLLATDQADELDAALVRAAHHGTALELAGSCYTSRTLVIRDQPITLRGNGGWGQIGVKNPLNASSALISAEAAPIIEVTATNPLEQIRSMGTEINGLAVIGWPDVSNQNCVLVDNRNAHGRGDTFFRCGASGLFQQDQVAGTWEQIASSQNAENGQTLSPRLKMSFRHAGRAKLEGRYLVLEAGSFSDSDLHQPFELNSSSARIYGMITAVAAEKRAEIEPPFKGDRTGSLVVGAEGAVTSTACVGCVQSCNAGWGVYLDAGAWGNGWIGGINESNGLGGFGLEQSVGGTWITAFNYSVGVWDEHNQGPSFKAIDDRARYNDFNFVRWASEPEPGPAFLSNRISGHSLVGGQDIGFRIPLSSVVADGASDSRDYAHLGIYDYYGGQGSAVAGSLGLTSMASHVSAEWPTYLIAPPSDALLLSMGSGATYVYPTRQSESEVISAGSKGGQSFFLKHPPIEPGSLSIALEGGSLVKDSYKGTRTGSLSGTVFSGTVDYITGQISIVPKSAFSRDKKLIVTYSDVSKKYAAWRGDNDGSFHVGAAPSGLVSVDSPIAFAGDAIVQGSALKHQRVRIEDVSPGSGTSMRLVWKDPFRDANYNVTCNILDTSLTSGALRLHHLQAVDADGVTARIVNDDAKLPHTGTLICMAMHP